MPAAEQTDAQRWRAIIGDDGKIKYVPTMSFDSKAVADAFSAAVVAAVLEAHADAFDAVERKPAMASGRREMDDEIPF